MFMNHMFEGIPEPSEEELTILTAEEYLASIGQGDDPEERGDAMAAEQQPVLSRALSPIRASGPAPR